MYIHRFVVRSKWCFQYDEGFWSL